MSTIRYSRRLLLGAGAAGLAGAGLAQAQGPAQAQGRAQSQGAAPLDPSGPGLDARAFGLTPDAREIQTQALEEGLRESARSGSPLRLAPGVYRVAETHVPDGAALVGPRGATLLQAEDAPVLRAGSARAVTIAGLTLRGEIGRDAPLLLAEDVADIRLVDMALEEAFSAAIRLERCGGRVAGCRIARADTAVFVNDSTGLAIEGNVIEDCANNGVLVWRSQKGFDGTQVLANRIARIRADRGGSGEYGNGVNVFRAGGVIVAQNVIRGCAFSAVRNNGGDGVQIVANNCADLGEVGLFTEFGFEGCVIADNVVERAANGIVSTNFNEQGRLAVISGNIVRGLFRRPDPLTGEILYGTGIFAEADAAITGNVVEDAETAGIGLGFGPYLRDVTASGNVLRACAIGILVSVAEGAGRAQIASNMISGARDGAIVGMRWTDVATTDLLVPGAAVPANISLSGNVAH